MHDGLKKLVRGTVLVMEDVVEYELRTHVDDAIELNQVVTPRFYSVLRLAPPDHRMNACECPKAFRITRSAVTPPGTSAIELVGSREERPESLANLAPMVAAHALCNDLGGIECFHQSVDALWRCYSSRWHLSTEPGDRAQRQTRRQHGITIAAWQSVYDGQGVG